MFAAQFGHPLKPVHLQFFAMRSMGPAMRFIGPTRTLGCKLYSKHTSMPSTISAVCFGNSGTTTWHPW